MTLPLIRELKEADLTAFASIISEIKRHEFGAEADQNSLTRQERELLVASFNQPRAKFFVVEQVSKIRGGGGFVPLEGMDSHVCELKSLYLVPEFRKQGIGFALVSRVLTEAKNMSYTCCYLETMTGMTRARDLYKKMGFRVLDRTLKQHKTDYCDRWMIREL